MAFLLLAPVCVAQDVVYNDLVWSDEFDADGAVNGSRWFHQTQLPNGNSWFNGEVQHYTNSTENAFVDDGILNIVAKKGNYTDQGVTKEYTSARLNAKFAFKYGRIDVRAKLPVTSGTWPAIWMLGKNVNEDGAYFDAEYGTTGWPACGEIDIMERGIFPWQPVDYVQSTIHTPAGHGGAAVHGGTMANNVQNEFHVYSMNWSPNQITFLLDGVAYYTYNPAVKTPNNWPFDLEQYLILNVAMGGISGGIPANFVQESMQVDYVRIYQNVVADTQVPTNFTASVSTVTSSSVALALDADDNSGTVVYNVAYEGNNIAFTRPAGAPQTVTIPNLSPDTHYVFTVTAMDLSGNEVMNNPIVLDATTLEQLGCAGTDTQALQGTFTLGYHYLFETFGTDIKITCELLDDRADVAAYLWRQNPFAETQMNLVAGQTFSQTLTGQTPGATINYAVKFAYAGGMSVTQYLSYVVGDDCALATENQSQEVPFSFVNPASGILRIESAQTIDHVAIYGLVGQRIMDRAHTNELNISSLSAGVYLLEVRSGNQRSVKKLIVK
ncbi:Por secretion system C-terminal sorting domain-containing protein [Flavobacterium caeni]|uniref:Por secretion system C-terminal sorting domain-containing protein n=1 Tax=Flavobacterium caeni TaxID=490189 RepID=A0A1G5EN65_9FLAO|nr:Por secretion system C-terminal sorting domain-containing protein [Flavobacterium caeni]